VGKVERKLINKTDKSLIISRVVKLVISNSSCKLLKRDGKVLRGNPDFSSCTIVKQKIFARSLYVPASMNGDQFCRCLHIGLASRETLANKRSGITSRQTCLLSFGTINSHLSTLYRVVSHQFEKMKCKCDL